jgi:CubicO group peptidase (beta-lactamase class C family)
MVEAGEVPSMAVSVYADGKVLWEEAIGWADRERQKAASLDSIYGLGSLSKSITATGLMVLVEQGRVDLDAPVDRYLGAQKLTPCAPTGEAVTVRQLLNCSGGIPHGWLGYELGDEPPFAEGEEYLRRFALVAFPPGQRFLYSNHAYGVAREIIAHASGRTYEDFMKKEVFLPLGMNSSGLGIVMADADLARGHLNGGVIPRGYVTGPVGGASLFSSASDIMRYARFHLGRPLPDQAPILSVESLAALHSDRDETLAGSFMALGWGDVSLGSQGRLLISNGEVRGANATVLLLPDRDIAIVALANEAHSPSVSDRVAFDIADSLSPGFMDALGTVMQEHEARSGGAYAVTDALLGEWRGEVRTADGSASLHLRFQADGGIEARVGDETWTLLDRTRLSSGLIVGSRDGALPGPQGVPPGRLTFHLAASDAEIRGYVTWATNRIDGAGEEWPLVLPGCVSLARPSD